jgi:predicted kinase
MQPVLYLMVGLPGAGKTTAALAIAEVTGAEHLWADEHRRARFGQPRFDLQESHDLYSDLNTQTANLLAAGKSVVFDTAFNHYVDRHKLRSIANSQHAKTVVVWVQTSPDLARQRATTDAEKQQTRILGDMSHEHFDSLSNKLEEPRADEPTIVLDGTKISPEYIKQAFNL